MPRIGVAAGTGPVRLWRFAMPAMRESSSEDTENPLEVRLVQKEQPVDQRAEIVLASVILTFFIWPE